VVQVTCDFAVRPKVQPAVGCPFVQRLEHVLHHLARRLGRQRAAVWRAECQFAVFASGDCPATLVDQVRRQIRYLPTQILDGKHGP
jgi:hypothetical protein